MNKGALAYISRFISLGYLVTPQTRAAKEPQTFVLTCLKTLMSPESLPWKNRKEKVILWHGAALKTAPGTLKVKRLLVCVWL